MTDESSALDTRLAKAMSHPLRQRLLMAYTGRVASPSQVARELEASLGDVSYHTKQLVAHGCLELVEAQRGRGGVKHFYRATVPFEFPDEAWSTLTPALRRRLAEPVVAAVMEDLADGEATGALAAADVHLSRTRLALDEGGARELGGLLEQLVGEAQRIQEESAARHADAAASVLAIFHFRREGGG